MYFFSLGVKGLTYSDSCHIVPQQAMQLEAMKDKHEDIVDTHEQEIRHHEEAIRRHKEAIEKQKKRLQKLKEHDEDSD